jgi:hypothetical protein
MTRANCFRSSSLAAVGSPNRSQIAGLDRSGGGWIARSFNNGVPDGDVVIEAGKRSADTPRLPDLEEPGRESQQQPGRAIFPAPSLPGTVADFLLLRQGDKELVRVEAVLLAGQRLILNQSAEPVIADSAGEKPGQREG